jgi:hypothetical protein
VPFCKSQIYSSYPTRHERISWVLHPASTKSRERSNVDLRKKYLISCKTSRVSSTPGKTWPNHMGFASRDYQSPNWASVVRQLGENHFTEAGWGGAPPGGVDVPSAHPVDECLKQSYNQATEKTHLNCLVQLLQIKSVAPDFDISHNGTLAGQSCLLNLPLKPRRIY